MADTWARIDVSVNINSVHALNSGIKRKEFQHIPAARCSDYLFARTTPVAPRPRSRSTGSLQAPLSWALLTTTLSTHLQSAADTRTGSTSDSSTHSKHVYPMSGASVMMLRVHSFSHSRGRSLMTNHTNPYAAPQFPEGPTAAQPAPQPKKEEARVPRVGRRRSRGSVPRQHRSERQLRQRCGPALRVLISVRVVRFRNRCQHRFHCCGTGVSGLPRHRGPGR